MIMLHSVSCPGPVFNIPPLKSNWIRTQKIIIFESNKDPYVDSKEIFYILLLRTPEVSVGGLLK